jgi:RNA polymerase sigma-70 factor, ECF subfamily
VNADRPPSDATHVLRALVDGDRASSSELFERVYGELRELAARYLARERSDHTLQPTALVHEAWMKLVDQTRVDWQGKAHFLGIAAQAMRRILVDHARAHARVKRDGGNREPALAIEDAAAGEAIDVLGLDRALDELGGLSERQAKVVELRVFGALEMQEIACVMGLSESTVRREWRFARAWLAEALGGR